MQPDLQSVAHECCTNLIRVSMHNAVYLQAPDSDDESDSEQWEVSGSQIKDGGGNGACAVERQKSEQMHLNACKNACLGLKQASSALACCSTLHHTLGIR